MKTHPPANYQLTNNYSVSNNKPYLAIFDLDETLIAADSASLWSAYLVSKGIAPASLLLEEKAMMEAYAKGQMDMDAYMQTTLKPMVGMDEITIDMLVNEFIEQHIKPALYQDAVNRITWHKRRGDTVLVISATGEHLVKPIANLLGADDAIAINLEHIDGKFTGKTTGILSYQYGKVIRMKAWLEQQDTAFKGSYGYSDSINDLPLLDAVDRPFAVNPDPALALHAQMNEWTIMDWRHDNNILR
ncbi:HAD family hydrolase [Photobacterium gaetbulicola]|uniref:Hydrolase n=1 Tax=Photobacterium gaetbulicola Gung47 TaxID=658445 RepID=A0A0C5W3S0_9GAMM|nr:HAD family hydrolase [Photobacterium gaetbulicola]AJR06116.1 hydrolase [Photobacterium gaetbulicola Gung47]PSU02697.1 HAD family hydrolase [Photobacterium gaetbulicola]